MKALVDFFSRYKVVFVIIVGLIDFGFALSPWTRQFGEIVGNLSLVLASLLILTIALISIDELTVCSGFQSWKRIVLKNGLRGTAVLLIAMPVLLFNFTPSLDIVQTRLTSSYQVGEKPRIAIVIRNKTFRDITVYGTAEAVVVTPHSEKLIPLEEGFWAKLMSKDEKTYHEVVIPPSATGEYSAVLIDGPSLTQDQVSGLQSGEKTMLYFYGIYYYQEWYWLRRQLEFCGSFRDRPNYIIQCKKHHESWAVG
jgi:hypothetical protein